MNEKTDSTKSKLEIQKSMLGLVLPHRGSEKKYYPIWRIWV